LPFAGPTGISDILLPQSDSEGSELSRVFYVGFKGDMREPRKEGNTKLVIPAANAADAPLVDQLREKSAGQQTTAR
jgi:hypothetical protein